MRGNCALAVIVALVVILSACDGAASLSHTPTLTSTPNPTATAWKTEEYTVYSVLVNEMFLDAPPVAGDGPVEMVVIYNQTSLGMSPGHEWGEYESYDQALQDACGKIAALQQETLDDFEDKNQEKHRLDYLFDLNVKYVLIDEEEARGASDNWDQFYIDRPNSQGVMILSRVGFNQDMSQALVYIGNQSYWEVGAGYCVLLTKENGVWNIHRHQVIRVWVS